MSGDRTGLDPHELDTAPGDEAAGRSEVATGALAYLIGLGLATVITVVAFYISGSSLVWRPSIPVALFVLAVAQMGVHLVFFLHITTGPDNVNNVLALAFGVLIVAMLVVGSLWIMSNLNRNMEPMGSAAPMQHKTSALFDPRSGQRTTM